jgi:hypothetical protein
MRVLAAVVVCAAFAALPAGAGADGDPASDVLLAQEVFYPYQPRVSASLEATMSRTLREAAARGVHLKVAIILEQYELGLVPQFYEHPQAYADFLDREISFNHVQPLLTVMRAGFGLAAAGPASALAGVRVDRSQRSYGLTRSAILAVVALARADGHPIPAPSIPAESGGAGSTPLLLAFGVPIALLVLGGFLVARRGRRPRAS